MKLSLHLMLLLLFASCSTSVSTTEKVDTMTVAIDTISVSDKPVQESAQAEYPTRSRRRLPIETMPACDESTVEQLPFQAFNSEPQTEPGVAYVYAASGLDVYDTHLPYPDGQLHVIGHVPYESRVKLTTALINNIPADTMMMSGLKGRLVEFDVEGKKGFIFSGYLGTLPVPGQQQMLIEYCQTHLYELKAGVETRKTCLEDYEYSRKRWEFERGILVVEQTYGSETESYLTFPKGTTLQEAYLFARQYYGKLREQQPEFPIQLNVPAAGNGVLVEAKDGKTVIIMVVADSGCWEEQGVSVTETGAVRMILSGGCFRN